MAGPFQSQRRLPAPSGGGYARDVQRFEYGIFGVPSTLPQSPAELRDPGGVRVYGFGNSPAFTTEVSGSAPTTLTVPLSATTSEWVDMALFAVYGSASGISIQSLVVDNSTLSVQREWNQRSFGGFYATYDVYGYGRSVTGYFNLWERTATVFAGFGAPLTHITPSGAIVGPPAVSGVQVSNVL